MKILRRSRETPTDLGSHPLNHRSSFYVEAGRLILQDSQSKAAIIACLRVGNLRLRRLELRLAQFDNGTGSQSVTRARRSHYFAHNDQCDHILRIMKISRKYAG